jgi:hypothetical protein
MDRPPKRKFAHGSPNCAPSLVNWTGKSGRLAVLSHGVVPHADSGAQLDMAINKVRQSVKQLATKGDVKSARILAREVVRSNKQKDRLSVSKARLGSIGTQLTQQMGACEPSAI